MQQSIRTRLVPPFMMGLRKSTVIVVFGGFLLLSCGVVYWVSTLKRTPKAPPLPESTKQTATSMQQIFESNPAPPKEPTYPAKGTALPATNVFSPSPAQAALPPVPAPKPLTTPEQEKIAALQRQLDAQKQMMDAQQEKSEAQQREMEALKAQRMYGMQPTPPQATQKQEPKGKKWNVVEPTDITVKHEGTEKATSQSPELLAASGNMPNAKKGGLITPANWEEALHKDLVLYRDQLIPGVLIDNLNSDTPNQFTIMVTRDVLGYGHPETILIPQFSSIIGELTGEVRFGQTRFDITVDQIITPDRRVIELRKTKVGDSTGAGGSNGDVNNHYGKLLLGVGISAVLNIGAGYATGTPGPGQYYQNPAQKAGQDFAQGVQREASSVLQQFRIPPTLTLDACKRLKSNKGNCTPTEVSIRLHENLSFQTNPTLVSK